jgi:hypothetical protein
MGAPVIRYIGGDERMGRTTLPVDPSVEIKAGWFVNEATGKCVEHDADTEDAILAGIALTGHKPNVDNRDTISIAEECEVEVDVVSANYTRGEGLKINGTSSGDDIELTKDGGANTSCWAAETKTSATRLRVRVNIWDLKKLRGVVYA